jgi:hypothetical protein
MAITKIMIRKALVLLLTLIMLSPLVAEARGSRGGYAPSSRHSAPVSRSSATAPKTSSNFSTPRTISSSYRPSFSGYTPPLGSRVYSPGFSFTELFFWSYLLSHTGQQEVQVQQPDGHTVSAQTNNVDVMYYVDLGIMLVFGFGIIAIIVYFVNKLTQPKNVTRGLTYGSN